MKLFATFAAASLLCLTLVGCAGSGSSVTGTVAASPYAGTYSSAPTLDGGKRGTLSLTVGTNGAASGTLTVAAPRVNPAAPANPFAFSLGSLNVSGTVGNDGTITMTGNDPNAGAFSIGGKLGLGSSAGSITISAGGQTFSSAIGVQAGGGSGSLTFSAVSGANVNSGAFPSNPFVLRSDVGGSTAIVITPSATTTNRALTITLGNTVTVGQTVSFSGATGAAVALYAEENVREWIATGGSLKLVARTPSTITIQLIGVTFAPTQAPATGTFKLDGSVTK